VSRLSPQEFRFMVEKGEKVPEDRNVGLCIPKGFYLEIPEFEIRRENGRFSAQRSYELEARIFEGIGKLREEKGICTPTSLRTYSTRYTSGRASIGSGRSRRP
jgi:hypothetical protein